MCGREAFAAFVQWHSIGASVVWGCCLVLVPLHQIAGFALVEEVVAVADPCSVLYCYLDLSLAPDPVACSAAVEASVDNFGDQWADLPSE